MKNILLVFVGGGLGSVCRYLLALVLNNKALNLPYGTIAANVLGSLLIGLLLGLFIRNNSWDQSYRLLAAVGFCGGFTTMSSFSAESIQLLQQGKYQYFATYVFLTLLVCLGATLAGFWLVRT